jgi:hypothetical protein
MTTSSDPVRPKPRKRAPVWLWVIVNQFAFPGLGTIMMRRRVGYFQASIMVTGFVLTTGYLLWFIVCAARYASNPAWTEADFTGRYRPYKWALTWGLVLCAIAWAWALVSSLQILRAQKSDP